MGIHILIISRGGDYEALTSALYGLILLLSVTVLAAQNQGDECIPEDVAATLEQLVEQLAEIQTDLAQGGDTILIGTDLGEVEGQLSDLAETCARAATTSGILTHYVTGPAQ